jgi:hypothetical protein
MLRLMTLLVFPFSNGADTVVTELINGLHFRRGIQNMQVMDMEWEIPIPAQPLSRSKSTNGAAHPSPQRLSKGKRTHRRLFSRSKSVDVQPPARLDAAIEENARQSFIETGTLTTPIKRDWTISQKAWWDAVLLMNDDPSVVRVALEMRVMGDSQIILAPQRGNVLGTCSIEILSTLDTPSEDWMEFCQKVADKWVSYRDRSTGKRLKARPHWCKQWNFLSLPGERDEKLNAVEWMKTVGYKDEIPTFTNVLGKIGETQGFTLNDLRTRFSNKFMESIFWDGAIAPVIHPEARKNRFVQWLKRLFR